MYCLYYSDGGLLVNKNTNKKEAYGTLLSITSTLEVNHSQVLTYARECVTPDTINIENPWNFYTWQNRRILNTSYGAELFNMFKLLDYIHKHDILNKYTYVTIHVDNKNLYKNLLGYKNSGNPYISKLISILHKKIITINNTSKTKHLHFVLISGKDMKLILGH